MPYLTLSNLETGMPVHINPEHIISVSPDPDDAENSTFIRLATGSVMAAVLHVAETSDVILTELEKLSASLTIADLDGSDDEADWIAPGHVLDAQEVEFIRSLRTAV